MLASDKLIEAFNQQVGNEMGASLQYIAIASYFDSETLPQLARFFYRQSAEEREHAMRFVKFLVDAGARVRIPAIPAPRCEFTSAEEAVDLSLNWEMTVTKQINGLMDRAIRENDHTSRTTLEWFVNEQLEEVSSMDTLLRMIRRAGEKGLLFVEEYLVRQGAGRLESPAAPSGEP